MTAFKFTGWRILVVDDDTDSLDMFAELLKHEGGSVDKTQSSARALQLLETRTYDLLISDVNMPGINGYQIIEATRRLPLNGEVLAIAMTGYGNVADREQARIAGFDIHLFKPASVGHIKAAVARYLIGEETERG